MRARVGSIALVLGFSTAFLGCSSDEGHTPTPPSPTVSVSASATSVVANGVNAVTITATDTGGSGPIDLTTTRGTFTGGGTTATIAGASGSVTLVTCDASTVPTCAGTAVVNATGPSGSGSVSITFGSLASVCPTNCAADAGCATLSCVLTGGGSGTCSSTTPSTCVAAPACTPSGASETNCEDGIDDDCNGDTDCADAACDAQACRTGSPTFLCQTGVCTDTTSGLAIEVVPDRSRLPAVAGSTLVTVSVTSSGTPVEGMGVSISTTLGTLSATTGTTGADGTVAFTLSFAAPVSPGIATLTASLTAVPAVSASATVALPVLGSLQIPQEGALQFPVMGARGSAWNELGWIQVQVLDDLGQPYPDGLPVRFEHRRLGGSTLGAPLTPDTASCTLASGCVGFQGVTSSGTGVPAGLATAWLYSGTVAGTLEVTATVTAGGVTRAVTLPTAAVVGARASGANFAVVCEPRNVPALAETDCAISLVDAPITCAAILKDRYNNLLGRATQVVFVSEAAAVGQIATTPAYDPAGDPTGQADLGIATQIFNTLGAGLPFDVAPFGGEQSVNHGLDDCGVRTHNPRDGVVTVLAIADGEEAFFDSNGSGAYDLGEPFVDQGEPFLDQDDSGAWEPGEWFLDVDGSGAYDPPNGTWDSARKIWTQTVVVYTSSAATMVTGGNFLGTRWADGTFAGACTPSAAPAAIDLGAAPSLPSQTYFVVASDYNLNVLHTGAGYEVAPKEGVAMEVLYYGLPTYADRLGFFYRYWPCDQGTPQTCSSQCRATGANAPCVMMPALTSFTCGTTAAVDLLRGATPDGAVFVDWLVDVPWSVYGSSKVGLARERLSGTAN